MRHVDCRLNLLPSAKPLKHRAPVHFHCGTAEIQAEVRLLGGSAALAPGGTAYARLVLREPAPLLPGDRFIIRMFSPVRHHRRRRRTGYRRVSLSQGRHARAWMCSPRPTPPVASRLLVRESQFGCGMAELVARTGMLEDRDRRRLQRMPDS